jgi:hypothetical protein
MSIKLNKTSEEDQKDRRDRRDRFMCAMITSGVYIDANINKLASWAEKAIKASDAVDSLDHKQKNN